MDRRTTRRISLIVALATALGAAAAVEAATWIKLGQRVVNDRVEKDVIAVGASRGKLEAVKLAVRVRPVHILDMKVYFANGGVQDVTVRKVIRAGGETRVIDLVGDDRVVTRVEFTYEAESPGRRKRAKVLLYGRR